MVLFLQTSTGVFSYSASSFTLRLLYNDSPSEYETFIVQIDQLCKQIAWGILVPKFLELY